MDTKNKIIQTAKVGRIVSQVLYILSIVACLVFTVLAIVLPLTDAIKAIEPAESAIIFAMLAVYAFFTFGLLWNVQQFFASIEKGQSIFNARAGKYLKKTAIFTLVLAVVPAIIGSTLINAIVPDSEFVFRVEVAGIITGALLLLVGLFFEYACELQKKDDETLWLFWT